MKRGWYISLALFLSLGVQAAESCRLTTPDEISRKASELLLFYRREKQVFPSIVPLPFSITSHLAGDWQPRHHGTFEVFLRPKEGRIGVLEMTDKTLIYGCAQIHPQDPSKSKIIIYFLEGPLDRSLWSRITRPFMRPSIQVKASNLVSASRGLFNTLTFVFKDIPLVNQVVKGLNATVGRLSENLVESLFEPFVSAGVERITITSEYIELAAGVDLFLFMSPRLHKRIPFEKNPFPQSLQPVSL